MSRKYRRSFVTFLFLLQYLLFKQLVAVHASLLQLEMLGEILTSESAEKKYQLTNTAAYDECLNEFIVRITLKNENDEYSMGKYEILDADRKWNDLMKAGVFSLNRRKLRRMLRKQFKSDS